MERKVAYIGKIIDIQPIKKADFIVSATVVCGSGGKWIGTIPKGQFHTGDLCEVYLQDAILPETDEFAFMKQHKYRVSMRRFKKVPSECLIWKIHPMTENPQVGDVIPGIAKYEKPIPAQLAGMAKGSFPTYILPKTDEPNFQGAGRLVNALRGEKYYSTVKADGSSGTVYKTEDHFGVCSRNLELKDTEGNAFWKVTHKYGLPKILPAGYGIQFELVGPGIQKNHMGLKEIDMKVFNVYDIEERRYLDFTDAFNFCVDLCLPFVEIIDENKTFDFEDDEALRKYAEGKYKGTKNQREGVVFRPMIETKVGQVRLSFKVINLLFKD